MTSIEGDGEMSINKKLIDAATKEAEDVRRMREAARRMLGPIEPDGSYAVDGYYRDAELVARAMIAAATKETEG
jgi:hypothetical protein